MTLQTRLLCELVRIPLKPEEREQPERDGKTSQNGQVRAHARTADPRVNQSALAQHRTPPRGAVVVRAPVFDLQ